MKKFLSVLIIILLISPHANALGMKSTMNKIMDSWMGEKIEKVFQYWGYPDDERNIAGRNLYYWTSSKFVQHPHIQMRQRTGIITRQQSMAGHTAVGL